MLPADQSGVIGGQYDDLDLFASLRDFVSIGRCICRRYIAERLHPLFFHLYVGTRCWVLGIWATDIFFVRSICGNRKFKVLPTL